MDGFTDGFGVGFFVDDGLGDVDGSGDSSTVGAHVLSGVGEAPSAPGGAAFGWLGLEHDTRSTAAVAATMTRASADVVRESEDLLITREAYSAQTPGR